MVEIINEKPVGYKTPQEIAEDWGVSAQTARVYIKRKSKNNSMSNKEVIHRLKWIFDHAASPRKGYPQLLSLDDSIALRIAIDTLSALWNEKGE